VQANGKIRRTGPDTAAKPSFLQHGLRAANHWLIYNAFLDPDAVGYFTDKLLLKKNFPSSCRGFSQGIRHVLPRRVHF
jgi:hypothetical protein